MAKSDNWGVTSNKGSSSGERSADLLNARLLTRSMHVPPGLCCVTSTKKPLSSSPVDAYRAGWRSAFAFSRMHISRRICGRRGRGKKESREAEDRIGGDADRARSVNPSPISILRDPLLLSTAHVVVAGVCCRGDCCRSPFRRPPPPPPPTSGSCPRLRHFLEAV